MLRKYYTLTHLATGRSKTLISRGFASRSHHAYANEPTGVGCVWRDGSEMLFQRTVPTIMLVRGQHQPLWLLSPEALLFLHLLEYNLASEVCGLLPLGDDSSLVGSSCQPSVSHLMLIFFFEELI